MILLIRVVVFLFLQLRFSCLMMLVKFIMLSLMVWLLRLVWLVLLIDDIVMLIRLLSCCIVLCEFLLICVQLNLSVLLLLTVRWVDRLIEVRLQMEMFLVFCGRQILVQRFDRWIVLVLLLSVWLLIVFFQVSYGWLVVCSEIRIDLNCLCVLICLNMWMWFVLVLVMQKVQCFENVLLQSLLRLDILSGLKRYQFWLFCMCFMNLLEIQMVVFVV